MLQGVKQMGKRGKHGRMVGDRRVLHEAGVALVDIHTSPLSSLGKSDAMDSFPVVGPLHHKCLADYTVPDLEPLQDGQGNLAQRESEVAAGGGPVVEAAAAVEVAVEVAVVVAVDDLHHLRTVWYAMLPPVGQYQ